jgi:hypothetical protein
MSVTETLELRNESSRKLLQEPLGPATNNERADRRTNKSPGVRDGFLQVVSQRRKGLNIRKTTKKSCARNENKRRTETGSACLARKAHDTFQSVCCSVLRVFSRDRIPVNPCRLVFFSVLRALWPCSGKWDKVCLAIKQSAPRGSKEVDNTAEGTGAKRQVKPSTASQAKA